MHFLKSIKNPEILIKSRKTANSIKKKKGERCMKIDGYQFGSITIDGKTYRSDLIIYPDGTINDNWWRQSSHRLTKEDIADLIEKKPEIIVVGTGVSGLMKPEKDLSDYLLSKGIELVCAPNAQAIETFNRLISSGKKVGACFHLTC